MFISKLISTANIFSSLYQPANFYTSILLMYILPTIYILMTFFSSKGKFSADASEVFIPDNAMILPWKCNETMVNYNVHFPRFYAIFATNPPFINKRFVTKLKRFWAYLRCFRNFLPITFECSLKQEHLFCYTFPSILRCFCD